ncbi:MAG: AtpZ/AtpI family protein [Anaerolineae bacterium]|nr:AtpZ/AtpI family protein [Anaerolineae bacterium]
MGDRRQPTTEYVRNIALAMMAGQTGCVTVILIFMALFGGLFLDARLNTHPIFTLGLVLASIPLSIYIMIRLMLSSVGAIKLSSSTKAPRHTAKTSFRKENDS